MDEGLRVAAMLIKWFQMFCCPHAIFYPGTVYLQQTRKIVHLCATHNVTVFMTQMGLYRAQ